MTTDPSVWWPLHVEAERWFSDEERALAAHDHRPVERACVWQSIAQFALLTVGLIVAVAVEPPVWTQAGLALAAIAGPRIAADWWREFVHEPGLGNPPVPGAVFLLTVAGRLLFDVAVVASAAWWIESAPRGSDLAVAAAVLFAVPLAAAVVGPRIVVTTHQAIDVVGDRVDRVTHLADGLGVGPPRLVMLEPDAFDGANALVAGTGRRVTVGVSQSLLDGSDELFDHVVGHELAHLRRRHVWWTALVAGLSLATVIVGSALVVTRLGFEGARLLALMVVAWLVSVPFRLGLAWLSRAHERTADRDALRNGPIEPESVRQLHLDQRADLEPSAFGRWFGAHPPPAERLERVRLEQVAAASGSAPARLG